MPKRKPSAKVASVGVTRTQAYVQEDLNWLFREQPTEDYGIDAHVEVIDGEDVRGRLLALQIKSGESWFDEPTVDGWWYRPDADHVEYWTSHSLPVVVILYHPSSKTCYWQLVNDETLQRSKTGGWRLLVPESNVLDAKSASAWQAAADGDPYELRVRDLRLARPWMDMLAAGTRLVVDFDEWINKSSGRGSISIGVDNEDGGDPEELAAWTFWAGPQDYASEVPKLFAWAHASVHEETYESAEYEVYQNECSIHDEEDVFYSMSFEDWRAGQTSNDIRPYANDAGEVDRYRVELSLNDLGRSFLIVDDFAQRGTRQLAR